MQEEAQGTGHTPKGLTDTSKQPSTKAPPWPFPQPQARVPCPHTLAGPEIHHPAESLSTCWVTEGHPPHWVWMSYQGAWLVPGGDGALRGDRGLLFRPEGRGQRTRGEGAQPQGTLHELELVRGRKTQLL